jgi:uncharacterized protein (DUF885 family)
MDGVQQDPAAVLALMPRQAIADYEDMLTRLEYLPVVVEQSMALMQEGLKRGTGGARGCVAPREDHGSGKVKTVGCECF